MLPLTFIPVSEIDRLRAAVSDSCKQTQLIADICRLNTLSMIMQAGSGHIGSSFSCMDIVALLWLQIMTNPNANSGDVYFSSKGHDAPGLYSVMIALGLLPEEQLHQLRRLNGLPGHPDVHTPYVLTNTGSLGMGVSKARGMALANRLNGEKHQIYVLTGDGELQEGQFWESLQATSNGNFSEITVIVDHNKLQSDTWLSQVSDLGKLEEKCRAFGWEVARCDGHNIEQLQSVLNDFSKIKDKPQILIADTIKGKGVAAMESSALAVPSCSNPTPMYAFHSGAPSLEHYEEGVEELRQKIEAQIYALNLPSVEYKQVSIPKRVPLAAPQKLVSAYGDELLKLAQENDNIVALDGDLMLDTGLVPFRQLFPERFVECGIAEQDMVSVAGGLALKGKLPVIHSFACFLSTRPNEQIYNNATEGSKVIYAGSLAGLLPAMPGHSHQSVRDISILGSIPNLTLFQPADESETRLGLRWAVEENAHSTYIRLVTVPTELPYALPEGYQLQKGTGVSIHEGKDAILFAYGPTMLKEAYLAAEALAQKSISVKVINLPWLNTVDQDWLLKTVAPYPVIFTLDDHYSHLGQGSMLRSSLAGYGSVSVHSFGVDRVPSCGQNAEVLKAHGLDTDSIAAKIEQVVSMQVSSKSEVAH
jgi:transketolase